MQTVFLQPRWRCTDGLDAPQCTPPGHAGLTRHCLADEGDHSLPAPIPLPAAALPSLALHSPVATVTSFLHSMAPIPPLLHFSFTPRRHLITPSLHPTSPLAPHPAPPGASSLTHRTSLTKSPPKAEMSRPRVSIIPGRVSRGMSCVSVSDT